LPLLLNQWANVVRWELRPRLFLRTSEFLWQEGHTAHATEADASAYARRVLFEVYRSFMVDVLAIPVFTGLKTVHERFAGATNTLTCEAMMGDGKALQMGTSHELGQNFARAFDIRFQSEQGVEELAWTTSWGVSTRMVGGLVMAHGDDAGLRLPPHLAPTQAIVMLVRDEEGAGGAAEVLAGELAAAHVRVRLDARTDLSFGRRATEWELKGIPARIEVGPRDLANGEVTVVRRDTGEKTATPVAKAAALVSQMLVDMQHDLLRTATERRDARTVRVATLAEASEAAAVGFARLPWSVVAADGEAELAKSGITVRCLLRADDSLPEHEDEADLEAIVARAY